MEVDGEPVAGERCFRGDRRSSDARALHQRRRADQGGEAAAQPADAGLAVRIDGQVSDLAGDAGGAAVDLAADDVTRADRRWRP